MNVPLQPQPCAGRVLPYGGSPIPVVFLASCCVAFTSTPATRICRRGPRISTPQTKTCLWGPRIGKSHFAASVPLYTNWRTATGSSRRTFNRIAAVHTRKFAINSNPSESGSPCETPEIGCWSSMTVENAVSPPRNSHSLPTFKAGSKSWLFIKLLDINTCVYTYAH